MIEYYNLNCPANLNSIAQCRIFSDLVYEIINKGHHHICLDFSDTTEMAGSFSGFLAAMINKIKFLNGEICFSNTNPNIEEIFVKVGFDRYIKTKSIKKVLLKKP